MTTRHQRHRVLEEFLFLEAAERIRRGKPAHDQIEPALPKVGQQRSRRAFNHRHVGTGRALLEQAQCLWQQYGGQAGGMPM